MEDRYYVALQAFRIVLELDCTTNVLHDYLILEYAEENVLFWREVFLMKQALLDRSKSRRSLSSLLRKRCKGISYKYIREGSEFEINISGSCRHTILEAIDTKQYNATMFNTAVKQVEKLMLQSHFPRLGQHLYGIVKDSWDFISQKHGSDTIGRLMYMKWFEIDPEVRHLFSQDISVQQKLMNHMIQECISVLENLNHFVIKAVELGRRHERYGISTESFKDLRQALLLTLEETLQEDFTETVERAWTTMFDIVSNVMIYALHEEQRNRLDLNLRLSIVEKIQTESPYYILMKVAADINEMDLIDYFCEPNEFSLWRACLDLNDIMQVESLNSELVLHCACDLFESYLAENATFSVDIPKALVNRLEMDLRSNNVNIGVFVQIWGHLHSKMEQLPFPCLDQHARKRLNDSWNTMSDPEKLGKSLFMNFFELCPEAIDFFRENLKMHTQLFGSIIGEGILAIDDLEPLVSRLIFLGKYHNSLNLDFDTLMPLFGRAFHNTILQALNETTDVECLRYWDLVFSIFSGVMMHVMSMESEDSVNSASHSSRHGAFRAFSVDDVNPEVNVNSENDRLSRSMILKKPDNCIIS